MYKACLIIPVFRHISQLERCAEEIRASNLQVFLVDDGNNEEDRKKLLALEDKYNFKVLSHRENLGKGAALKTAIQHAATLGYTHAIQIDADGQHDLNDIQQFIDVSRLNPHSLILGTPIFDSTAPMCRVYGRKITTAVLRLETFSNKVSDALFGFRVYPVTETKKVIDDSATSDRMGFDPEIVVRLSWDDVDIISIPSKVIYPPDGFSNFRYFDDNISFILLHTKLLSQAIPKLLIARPCKKLKNYLAKNSSFKWFEKKEHGNQFALKLVLLLYKLGGKKLLEILLYPVILYFFIVDPSARKSSKEYLWKVHNTSNNSLPEPTWRHVFHHFYRFGLKIVTSIQAWIGDIKVEDIDWHNRHIMYELLEEKKGGIIISAHYGCLEICRALKKTKPRLKVVPLMYLKNAKIFRGFLKEINPASIEEVIEIDKIHAGIATNIQSRIDNGQFISILADRISENSSDSRTIKINFMGEDALIPEGPYTLASIFKCPVVTFITYYDEKLKKHQVYINRIDSQNDLSTTRREKSVQMAKTFFSDLEHHCLQQPYEWFNFFPFWKKM